MLSKIDLRQEAIAEADRLGTARALGTAAEPSAIAGPIVAVVRGGELRHRLGRRALLLWRVSFDDEAGRSREATLVAMAIHLRSTVVDLRRSDWAIASVVDEVNIAIVGWREAVGRTIRGFVSTRLVREHAIARRRPVAGGEFQRGLFDRRTDRAHAAEVAISSEASRERDYRIRSIESMTAITLQPPELMLVLLPRDAAGI